MALGAELDDINQSASGSRVGAFFDFDGTLIDGYSAESLYAERFRNREIGVGELLFTARTLLGGTPTEQQFTALLDMGVAGWEGRSVAELDELGERLFSEGIAGALFHDAWRLVKAHQRRGHTVVIATSATRLQVLPLARAMGVEHVVCTELEEHDGILTGRVLGRPPWGEGKAEAVRQFIKDNRITLSRSYAYANGNEDIDFLSLVGKPRAINPQEELAAAVTQNGWPIIEMKKGPGRFDPFPLIRTAAMYGTLIGSGVAGIGVGLLTGKRRRGIDFATAVFGQLSSALGDVDVEIIGENNVWAYRPAVFMINHQSSLIDLVVTTRLLRGGFTAVGKRELADVPVIGNLMQLADMAFVDRGDPEAARKTMEEARERIAEGVSIVISPEGTRSLTPSVGPFKKGAFHLAWEAGVPVVPVVIRNAGELMWRNAKTARNGTVQVVVHDPIPTAGWTKADLDRTVTQVHELYVKTLANWPTDAADVAALVEETKR